MVKPQKRSQRQRERHAHRNTYATHKEITKRDRETERQRTTEAQIQIHRFTKRHTDMDTRGTQTERGDGENPSDTVLLLGFCVCSSWINFNTHFFFYGLLPPIILYPPPTTTKGFCKTHLACSLKLAGILIHRERREHKCVCIYMCTCMCMCVFLYWTKKISLTKTGKN
jgi:hypothetical protein